MITMAEHLRLDSNFTPNGTIIAINEFPAHLLAFTDAHWLKYPKTPYIVHALVGSFLLLVGIAGAIGNLLVIIVFSRYRGMTTPSNHFIINLAASDLFTSLLHPFPIYSSYVGSWAFGKIGCQLYAAGTGLGGLVSIVTLATIAVERFIVITAKPFSGNWRITNRHVTKVVTFIWIYCTVLIAPPIFGWGDFTAEGFLTSCSFDYLTRSVSNRAFIMYLFFLGFFVPLSLITFCYACMVHTICKHERAMEAASCNKDFRRQSGSQKTLRNKRVDIKTAQIVFTLIGLFLVSWTPYALVTLVAQFGDVDLVTPWVSSTPALFAKSAAMYNPIVYGISHPLFRKGTMKLISSLRCTGSTRISMTAESGKRTSIYMTSIAYKTNCV